MHEGSKDERVFSGMKTAKTIIQSAQHPHEMDSECLGILIVKKANKLHHCGTIDLRACWRLTATCARPFDARITTVTLPFIGVLFCCAQHLASRAHLQNSTGSVGVGPTTALLPTPALPEISARPSDSRPAIVASRFTGVLLYCALCLHISRTLAEPHGVRRRRQYDHAARCSNAPRQLQLRALDLLSSPC